MKLRNRKHLLNLSSFACLAFAGWVLVSAFLADPLALEDAPAPSGIEGGPIGITIATQQRTVDSRNSAWQRKLRQPLYDPPPPPKVVVQKQPRPVRVKLTGTVLEPDNSQAFIRLANGSVALKTIGDQVSDDPRDGHITHITASEIVIKRDEDEIHLKVEGQN